MGGSAQVDAAIGHNTELRNELAAARQLREQLDAKIGGLRQEVDMLKTEEVSLVAEARAEEANKLLPNVAKCVYDLQEALEVPSFLFKKRDT